MSVEVQLTHKLEGHLGAVYALCSDVSEGTLWSAGGDGLIIAWDLSGGQIGQVVAQTHQRVFCLKYFDDFDYLIAGTMEGHIFFIKPGNIQQTKNYKVHRGAVYKIISVERKIFAFGEDGTISHWNLPENALVFHAKICNHRLRSAAYDSSTNSIYAGDHQGNVYRLDPSDLHLLEVQTHRHRSTVFSMIYDFPTNQLITGGMDARICFSKGLEQNVQCFNAHWFCINDLCAITGTDLLASASRDKSIRIWNKTNGDLVKEISSPNFAAHRHSVNALVWNIFQSKLYSSGDDRMIYCWKIKPDYDPQ